LHSVFDLALRRRWISVNPCRLVDKPDVPEATDIRFWSHEELDAVLREGVPDDTWGLLGRPLYLMAAMTGMRQGSCSACAGAISTGCPRSPCPSGLGSRRVQGTEVAARRSRRAAGRCARTRSRAPLSGDRVFGRRRPRIRQSRDGPPARPLKGCASGSRRRVGGPG
jgi:hypothetical protein